MKITSIFKKIENDCAESLDISAQATAIEIDSFEIKNNIILPLSYKELLQCFNGGSILFPGTVIFGINTNSKTKSIKEMNARNIRNKFDIPPQYLIFAKLNTGDFICVNLNSPFDVIEWDNEMNELYCKWDDLENWLSESYDFYKKVTAGEEI